LSYRRQKTRILYASFSKQPFQLRLTCNLTAGFARFQRAHGPRAPLQTVVMLIILIKIVGNVTTYFKGFFPILIAIFIFVGHIQPYPNRFVRINPCRGISCRNGIGFFPFSSLLVKIFPFKCSNAFHRCLAKSQFLNFIIIEGSNFSSWKRDIKFINQSLGAFCGSINEQLWIYGIWVFRQLNFRKGVFF
jgi:hypothetical protein